jgi:hypothetical protein
MRISKRGSVTLETGKMFTGQERQALSRVHTTILGFEMTTAELLVIIASETLSGPLFSGSAFFDQFFGDPR